MVAAVRCSVQPSACMALWYAGVYVWPHPASPALPVSVCAMCVACVLHSDDSGSSTGARVSDGSDSGSHRQLHAICPHDVCLSAVNVNVSVDAERETVPVYAL